MKAIGILALIGLSFASILLPRTGQVHQYTFRHENVLGTSLDLKIGAESEAKAEHAEAAVLTEFDRLSKVLSAWDPASEFSNWTRTQGTAVPVSTDLLTILKLYERWQGETSGALNAAAATGTALWREAAKAGRPPSSSQLRVAASRMQERHWVLNEEAGTATHLDSSPLVLASFSKSYIADKAADKALAIVGASGNVVLNIGGDVVVRGGTTETVYVRDPKSKAENDVPLGRVPLRDGAIATSGNYRRGVEIDGRWYSHIIDPRTAIPADGVLSSTVQYSDPTTAGALATAFSVMMPNESVKLANKYPGLEYLIVKRDGALLASNGFRHITQVFALASMQAAASNEWNPAFELAVNISLARVDDSRYRRPYVAVWIEDLDKFPVKTIALWYEKPRWLPDLKTWYRDDRLRAMADGTEILRTVSSATRPPGQYTLKWDGKDNKGKFVKAGKYFVCVEAAREHGTYQLMRQEMDFSGAPKQIPLRGNTEIESVSLDYRKAAR